MSKKGVIQAGGTKEAPLAVVGSSRSDIPLHDRTRDKRYTPNDAEYQQYSELIKGFFQKFTRWQEILAADECKEGEGLYRGFSVLRSENGLSIVPGWRLEKGDPKEKDEVLYLSSFTGDLEYVPSIQFTIRPGQAGKHLFTGADNQPVERVRSEEHT